MNIPRAENAELLFKQRREEDRNKRIAQQMRAVEEGFAEARTLPLFVELTGSAEDELLEMIKEKGYCAKQDRNHYIRISLPESVTPQ